MLEKSSGLRRLLRYRLIVPILRGRKASQFTARGAAVGLAVAMTPTVGVQMIFCAGLWMLLRAIKPAWGFNLIVACAWTWITNVFTVGPFYYGFLVTGQLMLGNGGGLYGFGNFLADFNQVMAIETSGVEGLWVYSLAFFDVWGVPMFVGSLPWAALSAWLGYAWSLRFIRKFREAQRHKLITH